MPSYKLSLYLKTLKRLTILSFQYYKLLLLYNAAFTFTILFILTFPEFRVSTGIVLFAKIIAFPLAAALYYHMAKQSYLYFKNAGYGMLRMHLNAFVIDILVYALLTSLTYAYTKG